MSAGDESRADIGVSFEKSSCSFDVVVIISGWSTLGSRLYMVCKRSWTVVEAFVGIERVRGRPRPANVVSKTVTACPSFDVAGQDGATPG